MTNHPSQSPRQPAKPTASDVKTTIPQRVFEQLTQLGLLAQAPVLKLVVGFSGGVDSTVLLHALAQLRERHPIELTAAYYHHAWRKNPPRELPVLHKTTQALQIPLVIIEANRTLPHTETRARDYRYNQLCRLAEDLRADAVITAHHADDQVETLLFRLLRGTGIDGLSGIQKRLVWDGFHVPILRPMLALNKNEILRYASDCQLSYFEDPSNQDLTRQRNLLRKKVLPELQAHFPQVRQSLFRMSILAEADQALIEEQVRQLWGSVYRSDAKGYYLDSLVFNQLGEGFQRRILKQFLKLHQIAIHFQAIESMLAFIQGKNRLNLSTGMLSLDKDPKTGHARFLSLYKSKLRLRTKAPQTTLPPSETSEAETPSSEPLYALIPGIVWSPTLKAALEISEVQEANKAKMSKTAVLKASTLLNPMTAYVELNRFLPRPEDFIRYFGEEFKEPTQLAFRTRLSGDRFQPLGMTGSMPLKKYLINKAIPRDERDTLPLLAYGADILWIPGIAVSDKIRVRQAPTHRLTLEYCETAPLPTDTLLEEEPELVLKPVLPDGSEPDDSDDNELSASQRAESDDSSDSQDLQAAGLDEPESLQDLLRDTDTLTSDGESGDDEDTDDIPEGLMP